MCRSQHKAMKNHAWEQLHTAPDYALLSVKPELQLQIPFNMPDVKHEYLVTSLPLVLMLVVILWQSACKRGC